MKKDGNLASWAAGFLFLGFILNSGTTPLQGAGAVRDAGGSTHLLAFSRVSTFFHSSLFSDVNVSTLWGQAGTGSGAAPALLLPPQSRPPASQPLCLLPLEPSDPGPPPHTGPLLLF